MKKRILAIILAFVLTFTGSIPAEAADISDNDAVYEEIEEEVAGEFEESKESDVSQGIYDVTPGDLEIEAEPEEILSGNFPIDCSEYIIQMGGMELPDPESYEYPAGDFEVSEGEANLFYGYPETAGEAVYQAITEHSEMLDLTPYHILYDEGAEDYIASLVAEIINDNPHFFFSQGISSFDVNEEGYISTVYFIYINDFDEDLYTQKLNAAYKEAVTDNSAPQIVKIMQLHNWMCQHVTYVNDQTYYCHTAYAAIVDGKCVCQGYALAYEELLKMAGVTNTTCRSNRLNHIWNVVNVDGNWYNIDTTWDDPCWGGTSPSDYVTVNGYMRYDYFMISSSLMKSQQSSSKGYSVSSIDYSFNSCTSKKFDSFWWRNSDTFIGYKDSYFYYISDYQGYTSLYKKKYLDGVNTQLVNLPQLTGDSFWITNLSEHAGKMYFNSKYAVYSVGYGSDTPTEIFRLSDTDYYIMGCQACDGTLTLNLRSFSGKSPKTLTGPVSGSTVYKGEIKASTKTLVYGSATKAKLTASAKAAFDSKSANFNYAWYMDDASTPIPGANAATYTVDPNEVGAGKHKFKVVISNEKGDSTSASVTITVKKAATGIVSNTYNPYLTTYVYTGDKIQEPQPDNFTVKGSTEPITFSWHTSSKLTESSKLTDTPANAGTYYLKVNVDGNANYDSKYISVKVTINKAPLQITIKDQSIYWGEDVASTTAMVETDGLVEGDTLNAISLVASTSELTTKGTVMAGSSSDLSIVNSAGAETKSNYSITYINGALTISKIPVEIYISNQEIRFGEIIDDSLSNAEMIYPDEVMENEYVLGALKFIPTRVIPGEGAIDGDYARIYKAGGSSDISKYCEISYHPGSLTINKAVYSETPVTESIKVDAKDTEIKTFNIWDELKAPINRGESNITAHFDYENPGIFDAEVLDIDMDGTVTWAIRNGLTPSDIGQSGALRFTVETEYYEDVEYVLTVTVSKECIVTLHGAGGDIDGEETAQIKVFEGDEIPESINAHKSYMKLEGWYTEAEGGSRITSVTSDADAYAHWVTKYTAAAPTADIVSGTTVEKGTKVNLSTTTNGGRIYWSLSEDVSACDSNLYTEAIVINEATTLYAMTVRDSFADSEVIALSYSTAEEGWGDVIEEDRELYRAGNFWIAGADEAIYTGKAIKIPIRVYDDKKLLKEKTDYTLKHSNNVKAGTATVKVTGKGNYKNTATVSTVIRPVDISDGLLDIAWDSYVEYTGKSISYKPTIKYGSYSLKKGTDYEIEYINPEGLTIDAPVETGLYRAVATLKGNYSGTASHEFYVKPCVKNMSKAKITGVKNMPWTGEEVELTGLKVVLDGKTLIKGTDYNIGYCDNVEIGTVTATIIGISSEETYYVGSKAVTFKITGKAIKDTTISYEDAPYYATGSAVTPNFTVKYKKKTVLVPDEDYSVEITNNILPGNISVKITGKGGYTGTKTFKVKLNAVSLAQAKTSGIMTSVVYTGSEITQPGLTVDLKGEILIPDTDYTVTYSKNINAGTASVLIKGINKYTGSIKKTFKIKPYSLMSGIGHTQSVTLNRNYPYTKGGTKPVPEVKFDGALLVAGKDYSLSYSNNTRVGNMDKIPTVTITGKGNFTGKKTRSFMITVSDISSASVSVPDKLYSTKAGAFKSTIAIKDTNGKALKAGTDYEKTVKYTLAEDVIATRKGVNVSCYEGNEIPNDVVLPAGTLIRVTATGKGNYRGTISATYKIITKSLSKAKVTVKPQTYTGKAIIPSKADITVKCGTELSATDYEIVSVTNNTRKGSATMVIRGKGNYSGTKTVKFTIGARKLWW